MHGSERGVKKRRREQEHAETARKKKRIASFASRATVTVDRFDPEPLAPPVIATTPGIELPHDVKFRFHWDEAASRLERGRSADSLHSTLLSYSSTHQKLAYAAREEDVKSREPPMRHFLALYDADSATLRFIEAKNMIVRAQVRSKQAHNQSTRDNGEVPSGFNRKADLGYTFGTKKAKKALRDNALNLITPQARGGTDPAHPIDDATRNMLSSVAAVTAKMATREELQAVVNEAMPLPEINLEAATVSAIYDPRTIIGADILELVPVHEWQDKAQRGEGIQSPSRVVAQWVNTLGTDEGAITQLQVLRYFSFLLHFLYGTRPGKQRGTRQLPPRDKLRELLLPAPEAIIENIRRKFSDGGLMRKYHIDLLMTHCCALTCIIYDCEVDTQTLRDDLRLDQKTINQYFHAIGVRVSRAVNKERGIVLHIAKVRLPLDFPKQRYIAPRKNR